jgi:hypothetical protein
MGKASHAVVQDTVNAGVFVFGAGLERQRASVVAVRPSHVQRLNGGQ